MDLLEPLVKSLKVRPAVAYLIGGGVVVLAAAAVLASQFGDQELSPLRLAVYLLAFSLVVLVIGKLSGLLRTFLAWVIVLVFSAWLIAVAAQVMAGGKLPIAQVNCLLNPLDSVCLISASARIESSSQPTVATVTGESTSAPGSDRSGAAVFVQFAGFVREDVIALSAGLVELGWMVQGADRGGQRTGVAAGLNEVRYFHLADRDAAEMLANDVAGKRNRRDIAVKNFSSTTLSTQVPTGHLEVWISL